ncbi:MAG: tetratricopeptide repeat protein, partial [Sedimentisphaerales bacterium]|nr:tetratricopeptide repeat protein [Sedimentisphaerales bacterium]
DNIMAKGKDILNAALKALLAGVDTSVWLKIPATFIAELASLPIDQQNTLGKTASAEQFEKLLTQAELATTNAALAAVGTEQIKKLISNLTQLSNEHIKALTTLTQKEFDDISQKLDLLIEKADSVEVTVTETNEGVKELNKKFDRAIGDDNRQPGGSLIHNLPYASIGNLFKGREDILRSLKETLDDHKPTAITQTIQGLGGIGKTRLAVEFAWWAWENKKCPAVFFVDAETPQKLNTSLASLAKPDLLALPGQTEAEQISSVKEWLCHNHGWLMILDNADTETAAVAVEDLLPSLSGGRIIITSRYTRWSGAVRPQSLGLLKIEKAKQFLLERTSGRRIKTENDAGNAEELAEKLGRLPLILEQAAAYIAHERITLADYLDAWDNDTKDVLTWCNKREMQYPKAVAVTWQRTFKQLSLTSRTILHLAAYLAPEPIPTEMFREGEVTVAKAARLMAKTPDKKSKTKPKMDSKKAINELSAYSMITKEVKTFTIHRIVQEVIRSSIGEDNKHDWIEKALRLVNDYAPTESNDVRTWPILDILRPHAEAIARTADKAEITDPTSRLMSVLGIYLQYKGLYKEAELWKRRALAIDEAALGADHPNVATDLNNLAELLRITNRPSEAEPLMRRALAIDEASFGADHPKVA